MNRVLKILIAMFVINCILLIYCILFLSRLHIPTDIYIILFSLVNGIILYSLFFTGKGQYKTTNYGSHGSARWQTEKEAGKNYKSGEYGFVIGSYKKQDKFNVHSTELLIKSINDGLNNQFLVIGPPSSNKTTGFVLPNVEYLSAREEKPDLIITDPKGEVEEIKGIYLKKQGYDVYTLDFINFEGDRLNIFDYIFSESYILKIANQLANSLYANERNSTNQGFWKDSLKNILICNIGYFFYKKMYGQIEQFSIKNVLNMFDIKKIMEQEKFFEEVGGITFEAFSALKNSINSKETLSNILVTVKTKMNIFGLQDIQMMLEKTDIPIHKLGMEIKTQKTDTSTLQEKKQKLCEIKKDTITKTDFRISETKKEYQNECLRILTKYNSLSGEILITRRNVEEYISKEQDTFTFELLNELSLLKENYNDKMKIILEEKQKIIDLIIEKTKELEKELETAKEKPIALFIKIPDDDNSYAPIINMILSVIMKTLYETARRTGSNGVSLKKDVILLLEEFALIGELREFTDKLGGMRGRRIFPLMVIQSIAQLKKVYKDDYQDIISQCDNKLILGVNDTFTSEELVKTLGDETIIIENQSQRKRTWEPNIFNGQIQESQNYSGKKLINVSEMMNIDEEQVILKQRTREPLKAYKVIDKYWEEKN